MIRPGLYIQVYRGALRGDHVKAVAHALNDWGGSPFVAGLVPHSVNLEMSQADYAPLAALAKARGLLCLAAFGLGDSYPEAYGKAIADFARRDDCDGVVFDMEGAWENERDDRDDARRMFDTFRRRAPDAFAVDQPWFVPTVHSAFPWAETAAAIDLRCPQVYCNDFKSRWGRQRYAKCEAWHQASWAAMERRWEAAQVPLRPHTRTIQGYGWDDIPADLVACLLATAHEPALVWCDPLPAPSFLRGLRAVDALRLRGHVGPGAVAAFQKATGALEPDGRCGEQTLAALGVP